MELPEWRLPPGVSRSLWEYTHEPHIAREYDASLRGSALVELDHALLTERFSTPGSLIDLGCGTGRLAIPFAERGFAVVGVDLSAEMLEILKRKGAEARVWIGAVRANLCELDCIADDTFDYAIFMFSTLGMLSGAEHRLRALRHIRRILKPGGRLALHVHNVWSNLFDPDGRRWLLWDRINFWLGRHAGGDKIFHDRGIPRMYMHVFRKREILSLLTSADLHVDEVIPLSRTGGAPLARPGLLGGFRANGWIVFASR